MKRMYFAISILLIILCGSLGINIWLYNTSYRQYVKTESLRLDPYELKTYPERLGILKKDLIRPLVVFFGDSRAAAWSEIADIPFEFVNRGIDGQTTNQVLARLSAHVATLSPTVVVLQVGVNDLKNIAIFPNQAQNIIVQCKQNIQQIIERLTKEPKTTVILTTIFPAGELSLLRRLYWTSEIDRSIIEVNQFIKSLKSDRVIILDAATILADERGVTRSEYSQDHLHLNMIGYTKLNEELSQILKSLVL